MGLFRFVEPTLGRSVFCGRSAWVRWNPLRLAQPRVATAIPRDYPPRAPVERRRGRLLGAGRATVRALMHARSSASGTFQRAHGVELVNDGPVTLLMEA